MNKKYIEELENLVKRILTPMQDMPFNVIIRSISGHSVLPFKKDNALLKFLEESFCEIGEAINKNGIKSNRPNEVGNKIEPIVKKYLDKNGLKAVTPQNRLGKKVSTGYPDIIFSYKNTYYYLECKTYNQANVNTTQRSFYFSPSDNFKITKNAPHLMISFRIYKIKSKYYTDYWKLFSLEKLKVDLKHEFNQNNREMYGSSSQIDIIMQKNVEKN
ncbi:hypothetical protein A3F08_02685 [Candidatus Berkelbacteria bacterium RIFCSPHIGHO2_12_FULL_36_9]|uniref:Restriction endonuclease n=1 Tax=Candidatus Berkelbacteria bacterium RIFCSPHIGHO2_12_FULL_36_9 TaxID=1797469 RepID=A0A1F5EEE8_9BACT|nr:MAG: hypothetical protein A3F08_02685 [Candidatus Berkelbacteria bacterium RIFCSPHIGHO2_12_FULL_36_9]